MNIDNQTFQNTKNFSENLSNTSGGLKNSISCSVSVQNQEDCAYETSQTANGSFRTELEQVLRGEILSAEGYNIKDIFEDMDIGETAAFDTSNIQRNDALFYINLLNQGEIANYTVKNDGNIIDGMNYKNIEVSKTLSTLLSRAHESKKAVRLDFDNNVTVILKLSNEGKINAHFIPGDKAVEEYLKNNIPYLKQRFDEQNIPYANISYKQHRQRENGQQNKEKNNE